MNMLPGNTAMRSRPGNDARAYLPHGLAWAAFAFSAAVVCSAAAQLPIPSAGSTSPVPVRMYVFDCGTIPSVNPSLFRLAVDEVKTTELAMPCYLVVHPKGKLMWDPGGIPDKDWTPTGSPVVHDHPMPDGSSRKAVLRKRLLTQLSEIGYSPADINYVAVSHYHWDHTGNANSFASSTWLVREAERNLMFGEKPAPSASPPTYEALRNSKTQLIKDEEHDVFGDGTVVIKVAPGHTIGHQALYVKLPKTGPLVLSGDLYHFPESRTLNRIASFDSHQELSASSRKEMESFLSRKQARLWIQHDNLAFTQAIKAPGFYD